VLIETRAVVQPDVLGGESDDLDKLTGLLLEKEFEKRMAHEVSRSCDTGVR